MSEEGNVITLDPNGVVSVLEQCLDQAPGFEGVLVVAVTREGNLYMRGSVMDGKTRSHLSAFLQAYIARSFKLEV